VTGRASLAAWFATWWPILAVAALALCFAGFVGLAWMIDANAHQLGARAVTEFGGDEIEALVALVQSERHTLAERNRAVNTLGILADARALPVLEQFYTGEGCQHSRFLCQHELRKAITRCRGGNRPPAWVPFMPGAKPR